MKVTESRFKNRQLHREDYLQMVSAEQKEYAEVFNYSKITEKSGVIADYWTSNLLDLILRKDNLNKAYKQVKKNKGKGGIDGMQVDELLPFLRENQESLIQEIREGKYKPNPVRRVEIPKETKGEFRKLGVPTVVDRVIQQAIAQELTPIFEEQFSENSFGFRPKRGAHDALRQCQQNANEGYVYVVDMDLEKFFDTVSRSKLIEVLSRTIKDGRVISLIHKYLNAGVVANGKFERTEIGMPQGGPLSPLLSNIMLNELDKELERRGHRFVRYADDCMIFCKSRKSAERTLENIIPFIERKLFLKVNRKKTEVAHISKVKYLGYTFYSYKGRCRFRVHAKSVVKMRNKIRELTDRNKGICRKQDFIVDDTTLFRVVLHFLIVSTEQLFAALVGSGGNRRLLLATLNNRDFVVWTGHFVSLLSMLGGWGGVLPPHFGQKKSRRPFSDFLLGVPLCKRRVFSCESSGQVDPM